MGSFLGRFREGVRGLSQAARSEASASDCVCVLPSVRVSRGRQTGTATNASRLGDLPARGTEYAGSDIDLFFQGSSKEPGRPADPTHTHSKRARQVCAHSTSLKRV